MGGAQEAAHAGHPGISAFAAQLGSIFFGVVPHGAELGDAERAAAEVGIAAGVREAAQERALVEAHSGLAVDDRARRLQFDQQGQDWIDNQEGCRSDEADDDVQGSLQR